MSGRISLNTTGTEEVAMPDGARIKAIGSIMNDLHQAHSWTEKMMKTASQLYFWPGMKKTLIMKVDSCTACIEDRPKQASQPAKLTPPSAAGVPMRHVGTDSTH